MAKDADSALLIGIHTRPAVSSAKRLGLYTLSVDYFGDVDLKEMADVSLSVRSQRPFRSSGRVSEDHCGHRLAELAEGLDADLTILTSTVDFKGRVIGNPPEKMMRLRDKEFQLKKVGRLGVPVPEYEVVSGYEDALEAVNVFGPPCVVKPVRGAGGRGVHLVKTLEEVPFFEGPCLVQRYVEGLPVSTSTLSSKKDSVMLSTSEQILGSPLAGQEGFVYCGSIVPCPGLGRDLQEELEEVSARIVKAFGVVGWNGMDFVLGEEPVFMELNPRFQGTFDCVERSYGLNLLEAHIKACEGELIDPPQPAPGHSMRLTLFARERCIVKEDLRGKTVDVPLQHSIVEGGEPLTTLLATGKDREQVMAECKKAALEVYGRAVAPI
ncbi:MAG: ATP-grasp domain-containing protein [Methanobacteriota archaeon]|nr:MAG: ATP-grasp domain-containing protein [Euryarchaeota archaeon]